MSRRHPSRKTTAARFAKLPVKVLDHVAVTTLSHATFRIMALLTAQYHGYNNGALGITASQAAEKGIGSDHTVYEGLRTLEKHGLVEQTYPASRVPPRPTMYALTWISVDDTSWSQSTKTASHKYREWQPSRKPKLKVVKGNQNNARQN